MDPEDEIIARAESWQRAIEARDVAAAGDHLADDYALVIVQPTRTVVLRAPWLALLPDYIVSGYEVRERIVDVDGDLAVVLARVWQDAIVRGADRSGEFILSDVWRRRDGAWRVWRRHSTPLSAGSMPR
jgi:ketosteroid isomerase-like protein